MDTVRVAATDDEIRTCYPVMAQLRPQIDAADFLPRVRAQMEHGYRLAFIANERGAALAVAGFRIGTSLSWGRYLYVDDLITDAAHRSRGLGALLLGWLKTRAAEQGCGQLHLDSGTQRADAHRFYRREGMDPIGYHFSLTLELP